MFSPVFRFLAVSAVLLTLLAENGCSKPAPQAKPAAEESSAVDTAPAPAPEAPAPESAPAAETSTPAPAPEPAPEAAPALEAATDTDWLLVPGERAGKITGTSTEADLIAAYGADNVRNDEFHVGEGEMIACTTIFPEDDAQRAQILWNDPEKKDFPVAVSIDSPNSHWKTAAGLGIGSTLKTVEQLNGKPFTLMGFGWDYGGRVSDFNGGALGTPEGGLQLTFDLDYETEPQPPEDLANQVMGDAEFSSSLPAMQQLNPKVYSMVIGLGGGQ